MIQKNIGAKTATIQKKYWRQNSYDTKKNISAETDMYQQQRHATLEREVGAKLAFCD